MAKNESRLTQEVIRRIDYALELEAAGLAGQGLHYLKQAKKVFSRDVRRRREGREREAFKRTRSEK